MANDVWASIIAWLLGKYRKDQERLAGSVAADVARSWRLLDFQDLSGTEVRWLESVVPSVEKGFGESVALTETFVNDFRQAKLFQAEALNVRRGLLGVADRGLPQIDIPGTPFWAPLSSRLAEPIVVSGPGETLALPDVLEHVDVVDAPVFDERRVAAKLLATGPGKVRHLMPAPEADAMGAGLVSSSGAASTEALNGGRNFVRAMTGVQGLVGWQRLTDSDPCAFCALLASRGPSYHNFRRVAVTDAKYTSGDDGLGGSEAAAKVHDHCKCVLVPVFEGLPEPLSGWSRVALELWESTAGGGSADDKRRRYRNRFDRFKKLHPDEGVEVDVNVVRRMVDDVLKSNTDYVEARFMVGLRSRMR